MTNEVTVSEEGELDATPEAEYVECDDKTYFITGPSTSFIVQGKQYIRMMIVATCHVNGDDENTYKVREVTAVTVTPAMPSIHLMDRRKNTTLH